MKKPVILIFSSRKDDLSFCSVRYSDAVLLHGGIPIIVPMKTDGESLAQLCGYADGFLFAGGVDLDPALYGETKLNDTVEIDGIRDTLEMTAMPHVLRSGKPVFGICRGIQSVCVGMGGTLWQDIPAQVPDAVCHKQTKPGAESTHEVTVKRGTRLYGIIKEEKIMTNSFHHQSVKDPGKDLTVCAQASDGLIEALEGKDDRFLVLVQWHPEFTAGTDVVSAALFRAFIEEASKK